MSIADEIHELTWKLSRENGGIIAQQRLRDEIYHRVAALEEQLAEARAHLQYELGKMSDVEARAQELEEQLAAEKRDAAVGKALRKLVLPESATKIVNDSGFTSIYTYDYVEDDWFLRGDGDDLQAAFVDAGLLPTEDTQDADHA